MKFMKPLSDRDMYWLGYIRADGGVYERTRAEAHWKKTAYLSFRQSIPEPVEALLNYCEAKGNVRCTTQATNFSATSTMYSMSTTKVGQALLDLNIKGEQADQEVYNSADFWRGLLDGDGSVGWVKNGGKLYPTVAWSGGHYDMQMLQGWLASAGLNYRVGRVRSIFRLGANGTNCVKILRLLGYPTAYSANPGKKARALECLKWRSAHHNAIGGL